MSRKTEELATQPPSGPATGALAEHDEPAVNKWLISGIVLIGTIMAVLDSSIVNVALPEIRGNMGATVEQITWVVSGYMLATVLVMPLLGFLSARFGRKRFYMASVAMFTGASMVCGVAGSLPVLIAARIVQGAGGGVLMTISQAILRESFPREEQGMAMGMFGMGVVLAPAIGPTLGGWITDTYSWPWIFYINVPVGISSLVLVQRFLHDPPYLERHRGAIDFLGVGLMMLGLGALQLMLEQGERREWFASSLIVDLLIISLLGLALFTWRELKISRPAVDLRILKDRSFASASMVGGVLGMGLFGTLFLLPLFLQTLLGFTAMKSGMALMPRSLAMGIVMPLSGRFYNRLGPRALVVSGLLVSAYSFWALSKLSMDTGFWNIFWPQVWQGVGFSLIFISLSTAALSNIPRPRMTAASGLYNVIRQIFGSVGIALSANFLARGTAQYATTLGEHVTIYDAATRQWMGAVTGGMAGATGDAYTAPQRALELLHLNILGQASVMAYNHVFVLVAVLFLLAAPLALLIGSAGGTGHAPSIPVGE